MSIKKFCFVFLLSSVALFSLNAMKKSSDGLVNVETEYIDCKFVLSNFVRGNFSCSDKVYCLVENSARKAMSFNHPEIKALSLLAYIILIKEDRAINQAISAAKDGLMNNDMGVKLTALTLYNELDRHGCLETDSTINSGFDQVVNMDQSNNQVLLNDHQ